MNYHNITTDDMRNGDGLRTVLWVAGCNHHCKGCQNPVTWNPHRRTFMALKKKITQDDGVITEYHRILYVFNVVNSHSSISVASLVSDLIRDREKSGDISEPYQKVVTYETTDKWDMTVEAAYEYLKTLPEFKGAEDI